MRSVLQLHFVIEFFIVIVSAIIGHNCKEAIYKIDNIIKQDCREINELV